MSATNTLIEVMAHYAVSGVRVEDGIFYGDPWSYNDAVRSSDLRSGVDGPHTDLADLLCSLDERHHA